MVHDVVLPRNWNIYSASIKKHQILAIQYLHNRFAKSWKKRKEKNCKNEVVSLFRIQKQAAMPQLN
jgi:hypothetical protein